MEPSQHRANASRGNGVEVTTDRYKFELLTEHDRVAPAEPRGNEWGWFFAEGEGEPHPDHSTPQLIARPDSSGDVDVLQEPVPPAA